MDTFPLRTGTKQRYSLLPLLFKILLEVLSKVIRQENEIKDMCNGKEEVKLSLFTNDVNLYIKKIIQNLLKAISTNTQVQKDCKMQD